MAEREDVFYENFKRELGVGTPEIKRALHQLRQRFRQLLREEVTATVADPGKVDEELRYLCAALAAGTPCLTNKGVEMTRSLSVGLIDSLAMAPGAREECPHCHADSRIAHGLCLGCLLRTATGEAEEFAPEEFDAALAIPDTSWRIGNSEILEEIGRGGMGVIYRARQRHSRRIVALKRVLSYHADLRETLVRFRREAEAAASLDSPISCPSTK